VREIPSKFNIDSKSMEESPFLKALGKEPTRRIPVWYMRQAGRSLPEYREAKKNVNILDVLKNPDLTAELTLQPVRRYLVDAAILFSDIMAPFDSEALGLSIVKDKGPVITRPLSNIKDIASISHLGFDYQQYTTEAVKILNSELKVPLIGFVGGPFTIACYLIDSKPSQKWVKTLNLLRESPELFFKILKVLSATLSQAIEIQVNAGVSCMQIFDSWAGILDKESFIKYCQPAIKTLVKKARVPVIYFGLNTGHFLPILPDCGVKGIGIDWRISIDKAFSVTAHRVAVQGNLNPLHLLDPIEEMLAAAELVLKQGSKYDGFIFNLGHGILPETDPENIKRLTDFVHDYKRPA
jgi:uroporphyrinogen decarboxylase